jgi:hypothetical protein
LLEASPLGGQYDPPENYGIPNPLGPRVHNWKGGPLNEGSLYHGPVYTRPSYTLPWATRPLFGLGQESEEKVPTYVWVAVGITVAVVGLAVYAAFENNKKRYRGIPTEEEYRRRPPPTEAEIRERRIQNIKNRKELIALQAPIRKARNAAKKRGDMEEYQRLDDELFRLEG